MNIYIHMHEPQEHLLLFWGVGEGFLGRVRGYKLRSGQRDIYYCIEQDFR